MTRKWLPIGGAALVLCLLAALPTLAQGPPGHPIYATIEYVDQMVADLYEYIDQHIAAVYAYVDEQIGGGGGVDPPSWEVPGGFYWKLTWGGEYAYLSFADHRCVLSENNQFIEDGQTSSLAIVHLPDRDIYAYGVCHEIYPEPPLLAQDVPTSPVEADVWFSWMGETKQATYTVSWP